MIIYPCVKFDRASDKWPLTPWTWWVTAFNSLTYSYVFVNAAGPMSFKQICASTTGPLDAVCMEQICNLLDIERHYMAYKSKYLKWDSTWHAIPCRAVTWRDVMWRDVTWHGMAWHGTALHCTARPSWHDTRHLTSRHDTTRYDTTWHGPIQSSAVITRSNIVRCCINSHRKGGRMSARCWIHKIHPLHRPNGRARGCSCGCVWENWLRFNSVALQQDTT